MSLLRGTDRELTAAGEVLWIVLRLVGPPFFGLALLSLRGRVKRRFDDRKGKRPWLLYGT